MSSLLIVHLKKDISYKLKSVNKNYQFQYKMLEIDEDLFKIIDKNNFNPNPETKEYEEFYNFIEKYL